MEASEISDLPGLQFSDATLTVASRYRLADRCSLGGFE